MLKYVDVNCLKKLLRRYFLQTPNQSQLKRYQLINIHKRIYNSE